MGVCGCLWWRQGKAVKPRKGDALLFWSLKPDHTTKDDASLHGGCPVLKGEKVGVTVCERERAVHNTARTRSSEHAHACLPAVAARLLLMLRVCCCCWRWREQWSATK